MCESLRDLLTTARWVRRAVLGAVANDWFALARGRRMCHRPHNPCASAHQQSYTLPSSKHVQPAGLLADLARTCAPHHALRSPRPSVTAPHGPHVIGPASTDIRIERLPCPRAHWAARMVQPLQSKRECDAHSTHSSHIPADSPPLSTSAMPLSTAFSRPSTPLPPPLSVPPLASISNLALCHPSTRADQSTQKLSSRFITRPSGDILRRGHTRPSRDCQQRHERQAGRSAMHPHIASHRVDLSGALCCAPVWIDAGCCVEFAHC